MLKPIIFVGKAQSGKDTSCFYLRQFLTNSHIFAFATPLKQFCHEVLGIEYEKLWGTNDQKNLPTHLKYSDFVNVVGHERAKNINPKLLEHPDNFLTGREILQYWGSDVCRIFYPDCWAKATITAMHKKYYDRVMPPYEIFFGLISDARFPNEIECFLKAGLSPIIIRLLRNPINSNHKSEIAFDNYDFSMVPNYIEIDNRNMTLQEKDELVLSTVRKFI